MFSEKDMRNFELEIILPKKEDIKNPVEQLLLNCPLSTLKPSSLNELVIELRDSVNKMPIMILSGDNSQLSLSSKSLTLNISPKIGKEDKEVKQLSHEELRLISNDFNFLLAKLLGILNVEKINANLTVTCIQKNNNTLNYDKHVNQKFWEDFNEEDIHVYGMIIRANLMVSGYKNPCQLSFSCKKDSIYASMKSDFDIKGPIDLLSLIQERLVILSTFNKKLVE